MTVITEYETRPEIDPDEEDAEAQRGDHDYKCYFDEDL